MYQDMQFEKIPFWTKCTNYAWFSTFQVPVLIFLTIKYNFLQKQRNC